jgi:hypothetical protein
MAGGVSGTEFARPWREKIGQPTGFSRKSMDTYAEAALATPEVVGGAPAWSPGERAEQPFAGVARCGTWLITTPCGSHPVRNSDSPSGLTAPICPKGPWREGEGEGS